MKGFQIADTFYFGAWTVGTHFCINYNIAGCKFISLICITIYQRLLMEQQSLRNNLLGTLRAKAEDNSTYRKALTIYESILESTKDILNFEVNYCNSDPNFALFIFGSVYKLLLKDEQSMRYSLDSMLLLINQTLPHLNTSALKTGNPTLLSQLQQKAFEIVTTGNGEDKTPLMLRLAVSILSHTLVNTEALEQDKQAKKILESMFDCAVQSHRTNILSKQASRMLSHLLKDNPALSKVLSTHASMTMLSAGNTHEALSERLYLNNVREVIAEFPFQQINDIGHRLAKHLSTVECVTEQDELYLAQTYFFLEKLVTKFSGSTLQEICKELINNMPTSAQSQGKVIFCYIQCLHSVFEALVSMNERTANKFVSVVISILQQFIAKGGRIQKQAFSILRDLMANCIRKSLWVSPQRTEEDFFDFESIGLDGKADNFKKVVCMLRAMLGDQFRNHKAVCSVLEAFFGSLDDSALEGTSELIVKVVAYRDKLEDRFFRNVMHSIFSAMGVQTLCRLYPISIAGDIARPEFENNNNLWMLHCTEKYQGQEGFETFGQHYFPVLVEIRNILSNHNLTGARRDGYRSIKDMVWRCLKVFCRKTDPSSNFQPLVQSIKLELQEASDSTVDHIAMALENLCSSLYKHQYECSWANNLISLLAKLLSLDKNNAKQILRAIKYLSVICEKDYLNRVFDKNITKLIQQHQKGTLASSETLSGNLKNLEILIAVSNGINFYDPTVVQPFRVSREELVIKLIAELIVDTNHFQKKAYKYILETLPLMGTSYLTEVIDLLEAHHHKILVASKHYRLAILMHLWKQLATNDEAINETFEFIKKYLPEVLVDLRESNQRARRQAHLLFEAFCTKLEDMGLIQNFLQIMCAGLATDSVEVKVATIHGITAIYTKKLPIDMEFSLGVLEVVLMLLYEKRQQIYKAIVDFCRRFVFSVDPKNSSHVVATVIEQLFKADVESRMEHRSILKHFLLKLAKKFGRETIQKIIPADDRKILSNAIKTEKRERRQKREKQQQRRLQIQEAKKKQQQDEESDDEADDDQQNDDGEAMDEEGNQGEDLRELDNTDNLLLKYDLEKQNFHFEEEKLHIKANLKKAKQEQKGEDYVSVGEGGLIIVREDPKRNRQVKHDEQAGGEEEAQARAFLNVRKQRKANDVHEIKESGATFSSKRAGGDVKVKDKPEPYAFIQFNSKALNKRFKKRAEQAFNQIFERKEGGLKGIKSKIAVRSH